MRYLIQAKEGKFAKEVWWQCVKDVETLLQRQNIDAAKTACEKVRKKW